jgi:WD40 repeat protein
LQVQIRRKQNITYITGKRLVAGYADGTLKMFDLKSGETEQTFVKSKARSDGAGVLSVHHHTTRGIVAAGRVDGLVKVFNVQNGKVILITR